MREIQEIWFLNFTKSNSQLTREVNRWQNALARRGQIEAKATQTTRTIAKDRIVSFNIVLF